MPVTRRAPAVRSAIRAVRADLRVEEVPVPDGGSLVGTTLRDVNLHETAGAVLLAIRHDGQDHFQFDPDLSTRIEAGMTLIVMIDAQGRKRLQGHMAAQV